MSMTLLWSDYTSQRDRIGWNRWRWKSSQFNNAVAQSSLIIRWVKTSFSVKRVFVSCASRNTALIRTKNCDQVLCKTRQVRNGNFTYNEKKIKEACTKALKNIPKEAYRNAFDAWKSRWKRCIDAGGDYFEFF